MNDDTKTSELLELTTEIVAAHVGNNNVPVAQLARLIEDVYGALRHVGAGTRSERPAPAVPIKKSVFRDYIVCLEDGKKLKMLKRHLQTAYGLTPDAYRERWGLAKDYPMVAPSYARQRSNLAKKIGLGRRPRRRKAN